MDELMIKIDNLTKEYKLGQIGGTTLRDELQRLKAKILKREDPTKRIGAKNYNKGEKFLALDGVSFEVKKGERIGIIGHNGAGKSTLLKLLSRVTAPTAGTIYLNGRIASMLEVGTGFHPELTGRENIYMNGAILGMTKKEIDAKMEDIIEFSEVRQFIDTPVKRYSSGMYVKLAFAVAAHLDSEIMIMDEVLAVGDMAFQKKCLDKMNDVSKEQGRTILYVSHNMNTIRKLCNRVIVLDHGKIVFDGDVEAGIEIYSNNTGDMAVIYDYSAYGNLYHITRKIQFLSLHVKEKGRNVVFMGEKLFFTMHCKCNENSFGIKFRFEVFANEMIIGTIFSDGEISARKDEIFDVDFVINTGHLSPGKYKFVALAYEYDKYGNQRFVDRVEPAMFLEVLNSKNDQLTWLHQYWGYVKFDNAIIKKLK